MKAWLDNVALAFSDEALPLRDWLPILEAGLANLTVGVIPPALDQVLIGAIDRARNPDLKLAFVLGVNESVFPAAPAAPVILTDADRDELGRHAVAPGPDLRERLARERYLGYIACTRASEKLVVTLSRQDAGGKTLNPSPFIAHLRRIFPGLEIEEFGGQVGLDEAEHVGELVATLLEVRELAGARMTGLQSEKSLSRRTSALADENWRNLLALPVLKSLAESLGALREPDSAERLAPALAEKLFGPTLRSSVSRLEQFAQCPFRFFVHSGLRAEERKVFELDAREHGSFQHEVLKMFHEQLRAEGKRWRDLTPADARAQMGRLAAALAVDYRDGLLHANEQSRFTARVLAESLQDFVETLVAWMRGQYEFDPAVAELDFGLGAPGAPAWELDLGEGHKLALRGRIDRIDLCREPEGGARVRGDGLQIRPEKTRQGTGRARCAIAIAGVSGGGAALARSAPSVGRGSLDSDRGFLRESARPIRGRPRHAMKRWRTRDAARKRAYRHTGRFDAGALPKLDRTQSADQFNYRLNKDGRLGKFAGSVAARGI